VKALPEGGAFFVINKRKFITLSKSTIAKRYSDLFNPKFAAIRRNSIFLKKVIDAIQKITKHRSSQIESA
jgi:hypothetical protein